MKNLAIIKSVNYKSNVIVKVEDKLMQQFSIIVGVRYLFASTADAKRHIDGKPLKNEVEQFEEKVNEYCQEVEDSMKSTEEPEQEESQIEEQSEVEEQPTAEPNVTTETTEQTQEATEKKSKVTFLYFAVSMEDFNANKVSVDTAILPTMFDNRLSCARAMKEAGYKSTSYQAIAAAQIDGKIIGYGTCKSDAVKARWAA